MADETYQFCKIFVRSADLSEIMQILTSLLGGEFSRKSLYLADVEVEVLKNPDTGSEDDFVRWPTFLEVEAADEAPNEAVVRTISKIVTAMWESGIPAVAACFFEDELPWLGGIDRLRA
ncbi:hypothetical protein [Streptomyces sp. NPDC005784]|uniref:hypothetical protein n=1 Tax=Streptomyces sp. NPDC005784 TaxID=3364731 RepID=UPI0036740EBE